MIKNTPNWFNIFYVAEKVGVKPLGFSFKHQKVNMFYREQK